VKSCLRMIRDAARGLEAAYRHGIVHHDVKPGNILLDGDGNVKIGDFGLAQALGAERSTEQGSIRFLTPCYMSPEKAASAEEDVRGDIFSLGATFYHLVTGRPPWSGEEVVDVLKARAASPPVRVAELRPDVPAAVCDLIGQMMSEAVEDRPATYAEIIPELNRLLKSPRTVLQPASDTVDRGKATRRVTVFPKTEQRLSRGRKAGASRRLVSVVNLGIVLGVLLILTAFVLGARRRAPWYVRYVAPLVDRVVHPSEPASSMTPAGPEGGTKSPREDRPTTTSVVSGKAAKNGPGRPANGTVPGGSSGAGEIAESRGNLPGAIALFGTTAAGADGSAAGDVAGTSEPPSIDIASRPRPANLDFTGIKPALDRYLALQTPEGRRMEERRLQVLRSSRAYLVQLMKFMPFEAGPAGIRLRNGWRLEGSIPLCNDSGITVKAPEGGALKRVDWEALSIEQIIAFYAYYVDLGLGRERSDTARASEDNPKQEAARDCFRLALLCDWYGKADAARHWAARAAELMPELESRINRYVPTRTK